MERVGDHLRRGQDDDHRGREPDIRPGAAVRVPRLVIQEAWAWLTATQLTHASGAAARSDRCGQYRCSGRSTGRDRCLALVPPGISRMNMSAMIKLVTCRNSR